MTLIFKDIDDESLYEQLIGRLHHIERAFLVLRHIKLHYSTYTSKKVTKEFLTIRREYDDFFSTYEETLLWFMTVELWSRFLYAETKKGLFKLVASLESPEISKEHLKLTERHQEAIGYIKTQRNKYLAHADDVEWKTFPKVWDKEYDNLITDLKSLMTKIGGVIGSQQLPTTSTRAIAHTNALFNDLLKANCPHLDVDALSAQYDKDAERFISE